MTRREQITELGHKIIDIIVDSELEPHITVREAEKLLSDLRETLLYTAEKILITKEKIQDIIN